MILPATLTELQQLKRQQPPPDTMDHSMGSGLDECCRSFLYRFVLGIQPAIEPDYFLSGRAWDAAMHAWGASGNPADRYKAAIIAINEAYDASPSVVPRENRTRMNLIQLLALYVEQHRDTTYKVIGSNLGFRFPYRDFYLAGELDEYIDWQPYGVSVQEDKTTTILPSGRGWDAYCHSFKWGNYANQQLHYQWAVLQLVSEEEFWGTRIRIACLDIPKRSSTKRQQFHVIPLQYNSNRVTAYLELCTDRMERLRRCWRKWEWPCNGHNCSGSYGLYQSNFMGWAECAYLPICSMSQDLEHLYLPPNRYKVGGVWEPWNGRKE